ncbi:MAG TPA: DNA translocase FtsK 4TM domain-containing protein [Thermoanaerobaculia bacterium]|nr:DNA translocase FtsK 4TM domain-containing protein [Thermoanaerobaculia bacterium]
MSIADARPSRATRTSKRPERPTLSPEKGNELLGLALVGGSLLLAFSFATYHPSDPSLFHELPQAAPSHNWIGPAGAQAAALGFGFFGLSCFLLPLFLMVAGWRRLRRRGAARVVGRGFGSLLLLAALPGLCQLLAGGIGWRGETVPAGGAFGTVLAGLLDERMSFTGSLLVLASASLIGAALVVQSTLGQVLASWRQNARRLWQDATLARARRRERREKERARRRVITKHLQRVVEEKQAADARRGGKAGDAGEPGAPGMPAKPGTPGTPAMPGTPGARRARRDAAPPELPAAEGDPGAAAIAAMTGGRLDLPLRVFNRQGPVDYGLRRVGGAERDARPGAPAAAMSQAAPAPAIAARDAGPRWEPFEVRDGAADVAAWRAGGAASRGASPGASPPGASPPAVAAAQGARTAQAVLAAGRARAAQSVPPMPPSAPGQAGQPGQTAPPQSRLPFSGQAAPGALPPVNLLQLGDGRNAADEAELMRLGESIRSRCAEFGVEGSIEAISPGPVITVFEFQPAPGVKVSHIVNLQDDLALALKAESVRIERLPGRSTLGLEVPNRERGIIRLGSLLADERFRKSPSVLTMALGTTIYGEPYYADLATMPHLLVAGATGAGKSVGLQSMITSILYRATRDEVQFIFIDPKRIELGVYADIPHLKAEVVVDPKKAANALRWAVAEMERRYRLLAEVHVRSIAYYNRAICDPEVRERLALSEDAPSSPVTAADLKPMPYYVVIIDELADLMMVSSSDVETSIARLAQMARAVGIHLIVATQRPSVDVLTGTIKANFPCRISYATASRHDSRTILDQIGSEKLLGRGDMLMMPPGSSRVIRLHGAYVSEQETASLVRWLKKQGKPDLDPDVLRAPAESEGAGGDGADSDDELYDEAARLVVAERQASASFLQRRMRIGFSRAARLIDIMERDGLLGPPQGSKPREVLVKPDYFAELDGARAGDLDDD